jgi:transposase
MLFPEEFFDSVPAAPAKQAQPRGGKPRLRPINRHQIRFQMMSLDQSIPADHPVRAVWQLVMAMDLSRWLKNIKAVEGEPGRDATSPYLLVAIWVYATSEGIGAGRPLAEACEKSTDFRWLCGEVTVNHSLLCKFRSENHEAWDDLMTTIVAALCHAGLVTLKSVAHDGMRVRASAGKHTFRRKATLEQCRQEARKQVEALKQLEGEELSDRQQAARERAARERQERVEQALEHCEELQVQREKRAKTTGKQKTKVREARASTTDPEARTMQFADGGYRPGYNVQYSTDMDSGLIVGVDVTNAGSDAQELVPMLEQIKTRYDKVPENTVNDGGFVNLEAITRATEMGCTVYAPLKEEKKQLEAGKDPYKKKKCDSPAVAAWRERMGTPEGKAFYRLRGQIAEWVNAQARNRGLQRFTVRGSKKCRTVATLFALTHNLIRSLALCAEREKMMT